MSRDFDRAGAVDYIALGDIAAARFPQLSTWTLIGFIRQTTSDATAESSFFSKWGGGGAETFRGRINNGTAPQEPEIYMAGVEVITGPDVIELNTWYMYALTNDGTGDAGQLKLYLATMDGVFDPDYNPATGTCPVDEATLTTPIEIGRESGGGDTWDGVIADIAYFTSEFSSAKILQYLRFPTRVAVAEGGGCVYHLPFGFGSPEPDMSGNQNNGTVNGSPSIVAMPPTALFTPHWVTVEPVSVAAVGMAWPSRNHPSRNPILRL